MVEEQVLWLQVAMYNSEFMEILNTADDLLEEFARLSFLKLLFLDNIIEELTPRHKLHDQEELLRRLNDFKELDDVWVSDHFQDLNFSRHALHICISDDFALFKNFDSNL